MMSLKDIEMAHFMANVWKLNDERNKRIEAEKRLAGKDYKVKVIDDAIQE
jgi:hypothetical protein